MKNYSEDFIELKSVIKKIIKKNLKCLHFLYAIYI